MKIDCRFSHQNLVRSGFVLIALFGPGCARNSLPGSEHQESRLDVPQGPLTNVQAHRGGTGLRPEHTLPAIENVLDLGVDAIEVDLQFSADGIVVLWHDAFITARKCRLAPSSQSLAPDPDRLPAHDEALMLSGLTFEQLRSYRCDRNPNPSRYPDQSQAEGLLSGDQHRLVSLDELLFFVQAYEANRGKTRVQRTNARRVRFTLELKRSLSHPEYIGDGFDGVNPGAFEVAVLRILGRHQVLERTVLQSFDPRSLRAIRALEPSVRLAMLTDSKLASPLVGFASLGVDIWSPYHETVSSARVAEAHALGLLVVPWTVNNLKTFRRLSAACVDGFITDFPDWLRFPMDETLAAEPRTCLLLRKSTPSRCLRTRSIALLRP